MGGPTGFTKSIHSGGPEQQLKPMASRPSSSEALSGEGLRFGLRDGLLEKDEGSKELISPEVPQLGHCINLMAVESMEGREVDDNPKVMASPGSRGEVKMREESTERDVLTTTPSYSSPSFLDQASIPKRPFSQGGCCRRDSGERDALSSQPLRVVLLTVPLREGLEKSKGSIWKMRMEKIWERGGGGEGVGKKGSLGKKAV